MSSPYQNQGYPAPGVPAQPGYGGPPGMPAQPNYQQPPMNMQPMPGQNPMMQPMMQQPQGGETWMPVPQGIPNCPAGLEYLTQIDQLLVKQKVEALEVITNIETANKYKVKNSMGQDLYVAKEKSNFCTRQCCGPIRCFQMEINDNTGREVLHLDRPLNCSSCCFPCCLQSMTVTSPLSGECLGIIKQRWHPYLPIFDVCDSSGTPVLEIEGPFCSISCCGDVNFPVKTRDGQEIGKISKQWSGLAREAFTDADNFGISFPLDLDVKTKATLLGTVFLIDFMFFEQAQDKQQHNTW